MHSCVKCIHYNPMGKNCKKIYSIDIVNGIRTYQSAKEIRKNVCGIVPKYFEYAVPHLIKADTITNQMKTDLIEYQALKLHFPVFMLSTYGLYMLFLNPQYELMHIAVNSNNFPIFNYIFSLEIIGFFCHSFGSIISCPIDSIIKTGQTYKRINEIIN